MEFLTPEAMTALFQVIAIDLVLAGDDAHQNCLGPHLFRQAGSGEADHDGIVTRQHKVNGNHLKQCRQGFGCQEFRVVILRAAEVSPR